MNVRCGFTFAGLTAVLAVLRLGAQTIGGPISRPAAPQTARVESRVTSTPGKSCSALRSLRLEDTVIESAAVVDNGSFSPPASTSLLKNLPAFCRVVAVAKPAVRFEVWMPLEKWTGRFEVVGNGGMAGTVPYSSLAGALRRGNVAAGTDTGHVNRTGEGFDASWALEPAAQRTDVRAESHTDLHADSRADSRPDLRMDLVEDFGHRSVHVTAMLGKRITTAFYARPADHAYFFGCSKGGGQALMEAERYPGDFDGIVAGDPAYNWTNLYTGAHLYYSQVMLKDPESYIEPAKVRLLADAVNKACDAKDGITDGVIDNPLACHPDLKELVCNEGDDKGACFTPKQLESVRRIWEGKKDENGRQVFPGLVPGGEAGANGWQAWVTGSAPRQQTHWKAADGFFRYMVMTDTNYDALGFDWDHERDRKLVERFAPALNADNADLRPFQRHGGKLILFHGWSDPDISPVNTINFYQRVQDKIGEGTRGFARLFLVPGMQHCSGGPGPDQFDAVAAVEHWVEEGVAPDKIIASHLTHGAVDRTRPLCPYPQVAVYAGKGDVKDAASFACRVPGQKQ